MSYTLLSEVRPKARKEHRCIWCSQSIPVGETYVRETSVYDGEMQDHKWHEECLSACLEYLKDGLHEDFMPYVNERPEKDGK